MLLIDDAISTGPADYSQGTGAAIALTFATVRKRYFTPAATDDSGAR